MLIQGHGTAGQESCPSRGWGSELWRLTCPALEHWHRAGSFLPPILTDTLRDG